jgi:hypothetical protein
MELIFCHSFEQSKLEHDQDLDVAFPSLGVVV